MTKKETIEKLKSVIGDLEDVAANNPDLDAADDAASKLREILKEMEKKPKGLELLAELVLSKGELFYQTEGGRTLKSETRCTLEDAAARAEELDVPFSEE